MATGAVVVTPNHRLSHQLLQDFFNQSTSSLIDKPRCYSYQVFLQDFYQRAKFLYAHQTHPMLLNQQQARALWRTILKENEEIISDGLLSEVTEAWRRCQQWHIDILDESFSYTPQCRRLKRWHQTLLKRLIDLNALLEDQLATHLLTYPELFANTTVIWTCFDELTKEQQILIEKMEQQNAPQYKFDLPDKSSSIQRYQALDPQDEYVQMIHWLMDKLAQNEQRIAVVVPDLKEQSNHLKRLLQRYIPAHQFNVSLGEPLIKYPLIAHAFTWLNLQLTHLTRIEGELLLLSPYLKGATNELIPRAGLLESMSMLQEAQTPLTQFIKALTSSAPILADALSSLTSYPSTASVATWVSCFKQRLKILGFPGDLPLNSLSYQCFKRLMILFDEFLELSLPHPEMTESQALDAFCDLANTTIFQAQTPTTPIQILGFLEASGCTFDSIWVTGLTDECLPQKTRLSPFIPITLQHEQHMPHAVPEKELTLATTLLTRLKNGCNDIVFSYPRLSGDLPNLPSPLIQGLPTFSRREMISPTQKALSTFVDDYLLPFPTQATPIKGGTAVLANQAKCPFKAFAAHRLEAMALPLKGDGLNARIRGQIMHQLLELMWKKIHTQQQLQALTDYDWDTLCQDLIQKTLHPLLEKHPQALKGVFYEVEETRLKRLLDALKTWETARPAFNISMIEQAFTIELSGLQFRVRVDRLDTVSREKTWVIDYKTSLPTSKPWLEERPEAPQLLLYALLDPSITGLVFLQLKAGTIVASGISEEIVSIQGITSLKKAETWSGLQAQWHTQLSKLAEEYKTGQCPPTPSKTSSCLQCDFPSLCRVGQN